MQFFDEQTQTAIVVCISFALILVSLVVDHFVRRRWQREDEIELASALLRKHSAEGRLVEQ